MGRFADATLSASPDQSGGRRNECRGAIWNGEGAVADAEGLCSADSLVDAATQTYRVALPPWGRAVLRQGHTQYLIQEVAANPDLAVPPLAGPRKHKGRSVFASSFLHAVVLCVGSLFVSFPAPRAPAPPETRFVQIEAKELEALARKIPPPIKLPEPPPPPPPEPQAAAKPPVVKPAETAVAKAPPPKKIQPAPKLAPAPPSETAPPAAAAAAPPESQPPAETLTQAAADASPPPETAAAPAPQPEPVREVVPPKPKVNVNKAGILGALRLPEGINLGAGEAIAAVTNLDAVPSVRAADAPLKVAAIPGKLGGTRIQVPTVGIVNTKGAAQAVSNTNTASDATGATTVASLDRAPVAERQKVMAMVKADFRTPVQINGGLSREEVKKVIDQHMDEITYCYETALIEDPKIAGKLTFEWRIQESGKVGEVRIQSSSIRSESLHGCIRDRIRGWGFPKPRGAEVLVSYPFIFDVVGF